MHIVSALVLAALGQSALATQHYAPLASPRRSGNAKRLPAQEQILSCTETYGPGSQVCGRPELKLCFNAGAGESCCGMDGGFCKAGWHCAPVASFCCKDGEDLETCARNAGFQLPSVSAINGVTNTTSPSSSAQVLPISFGASNSSATVGPLGNSTTRSVSAIFAAATASAVTDCHDSNDDDDVQQLQTTYAPLPSRTAVAPITLAGAANNTGVAAITAAAATDSGYQTLDVEPTTVPTINQFQHLTLPATTPLTAAASTGYDATPSATTISPIVQIAAAPSAVRPPATGGVWSCVMAAAAVMFVMAV